MQRLFLSSLCTAALSLSGCDFYYICDSKPELCSRLSYQTADGQPLTKVDRDVPVTLSKVTGWANTPYRIQALLSLGGAPMDAGSTMLVSPPTASAQVQPVDYGSFSIMVPLMAPRCRLAAQLTLRQVDGINPPVPSAEMMEDSRWKGNTTILDLIDSRMATLKRLGVYDTNKTSGTVFREISRLQLYRSPVAAAPHKVLTSVRLVDVAKRLLARGDLIDGMNNAEMSAYDSIQLAGWLPTEDLRLEIQVSTVASPCVAPAQNAYMAACASATGSKCSGAKNLGVCLSSSADQLFAASDSSGSTVAIVDEQQKLRVFDTGRTGTMLAPTELTGSGADGVRHVTFGDLDGDGTPELLGLRAGAEPLVIRRQGMSLTVVASEAALGMFRSDITAPLRKPSAVAGFAQLNACGSGTDLVVAEGASLSAIYAQDGRPLLGNSHLATKSLTLDPALPPDEPVTALDVRSDNGAQLVLIATQKSGVNARLHLYRIERPTP